MSIFRIFVWTILLTSTVNFAFGQVEADIYFYTDIKSVEGRKIRLHLVGQKDSISIVNYIDTAGIGKKQVTVNIPRDIFKCIFEYDDSGKTIRVNYSFDTRDPKLKRVELNFSFGYYENQQHFLEDITVDKFFYTDSVVMYPAFEKQIGSQPTFVLINNSNKTFYGCSSTNHFYGSLRQKRETSWTSFSGSYCSSTVPEKVFKKSDTIVSFIPTYFEGDEYKFVENGRYKYVVSLGTERYTSGIPRDFLKKRKTRMRTRIFYELESEFEIGL